MTTDKEYASIVRNLSSVLSAPLLGGVRRALDRALELLDPPAVTDEAELEHCRLVAAEIMADEHDTSENLVDAFMSERAAARRELQAQFELPDETDFEFPDDATMRAELEASGIDVDAAAGRIRKLVEVCLERNALADELAALRAEHERLKAALREAIDVRIADYGDVWEGEGHPPPQTANGGEYDEFATRLWRVLEGKELDVRQRIRWEVIAQAAISAQPQPELKLTVSRRRVAPGWTEFKFLLAQANNTEMAESEVTTGAAASAALAAFCLGTAAGIAIKCGVPELATAMRNLLHEARCIGWTNE